MRKREPRTDWASFSGQAAQYAFQVRECSKWHWQILFEDGTPLVNYWPTAGKYGKSIEQHAKTPNIPMKAKVGTIREALDFAADILIEAQGK